MQLWVVVGTLGTCIACHNLASRYFYVLGRDRLLPSTLGHTRGRFGTPWHASMVQLTISVVVLAACALGDVDPYIQLGTGLFALSVLGIAGLMAVASLAVIRFFRTEQPGAIVPTLIIPALAFAGLTYIVIAVLNNYPALVGTTSGVLPKLPWVLVAAIVVALAYAGWLRSSRPDRYDGVGELGVDRTQPVVATPEPAVVGD
jgi:amino acid transporter